MDKRSLTETDVRTKYITPAITGAGWDVQRQVREEVTFTAGRVIERGSVHTRGKRKRADYVLSYEANLPLAVVEAKDNSHSVGAGMQQALDYAEALDVPFAYSSNGDGFIEHDRIGQGEAVERELALDAFPSPADLWARYRRWKGLSDEAERVVLQDYHTEAGGKEPRYYQRVAINRAVEAVARGDDRLLLVMATGTGKTYTAFQIIWRLWKAGRAKRVLFLADRNVLVDQARQNDFRPFGGAMVKVQREVDKSFEVYLALYQAIVGADGRDDLFRQFSPDFFDLVVIDECHRGSAAEDSAWRAVLDYFAPAVHLGLTATPKETTDVSTTHYFGDPVYTYSLKQGIEDGFLAPYRVVRVGLDRDLDGWRPEQGRRDKHGELIEDRVFGQKDFDRTLVIDERTRAVAEKVTEYLKATDRYAKTIVFCVDIDHAERMRQALVNANPDLAAADRRYVVRITGDSPEGLHELSSFRDPEKRLPVLATTSKMLTTGVDVPTCKLIVLDAPIGSMAEFKQIIGRGTRLREDYGKVSFTIMDFRKNTDKFADPDFDGEPIQVYEPGPVDPPTPPPAGGPDPTGGDPPEPPGPPGPDPITPPAKYYVDGVTVKVVNERVQYYGAGGQLITESLRDYTRKAVREQYDSLDDFLTRWSAADRKRALVDQMAEQGLFLAELEREVAKTLGTDAAGLDPFDLVCHVAFDRPPLTRSERARRVRESAFFDRYEAPARAVLDALLDKYADEGIDNIEEIGVLRVRPLNEFGSPVEIVRLFGGPDQYHASIRDLERELYRAA